MTTYCSFKLFVTFHHHWPKDIGQNDVSISLNTTNALILSHYLAKISITQKLMSNFHIYLLCLDEIQRLFSKFVKIIKPLFSY